LYFFLKLSRRRISENFRICATRAKNTEGRGPNGRALELRANRTKVVEEHLQCIVDLWTVRLRPSRSAFGVFMLKAVLSGRGDEKGYQR
jgi:hypothetical protein